jgi:rubrerythrin
MLWRWILKCCQLAVDLTAHLARTTVSDKLRQALNFALLEDFDHLYRYANLLESETGIKAETLVGKYTEIMPGRPTIAHHRHPFDSVKMSIGKDAELLTKLQANIITAAEQQTMNFYMNVQDLYTSEAGRELYAEIAMVEEDHVSHYGSLLDTSATPFECLLMHEYTECYLYHSMYLDESDERIKGIWEMLLDMEISHLNFAAELLEKYEKRHRTEVIPDGSFPEPLKLHENKDYVREVLASTVTLTAEKEGYLDVADVGEGAEFFAYQRAVNRPPEEERGHTVIEAHIESQGEDYRYQEGESPISVLRDRTSDNYRLGVDPKER